GIRDYKVTGVQTCALPILSSYNPFVALHWLITGKTVGGTALYGEGNRLDRMEALRLYTVGSSWFSSEDGKKGAMMPGQLADLSRSEERRVGKERRSWAAQL